MVEAAAKGANESQFEILVRNQAPEQVSDAAQFRGHAFDRIIKSESLTSERSKWDD